MTAKPSGWIFFDAQCGLCVAARRRLGRIFERRGFMWLPLQAPGTAERLGLTESRLLEEMWLQLADGRKFGGVKAWTVLMRCVGWMWPLGFLIDLPGFNAIGRVLYRRIANNRRCLGGLCRIRSQGETSPRVF